MIFYEGGGQFPIINTGFMCVFELSFFIICDLTYSTVICYEDGKFPVIDTMVSCVLLSYLMISGVTYSTVICHEACKFPVIDKLVSVWL